MKTILVITFILMNYLFAEKQPIYTIGKITQGKNVTYYCDTAPLRALLSIRNINNQDTLDTMYFNDETLMINEEYGDLLGEALYEEKEVVQAFQEMLTEEEWNRIKVSESGAFFIFITYDKSGEPKEVTFRLFKKDPLLCTLAPERLFQFEQAIKNITKRQIKATGKYLVNPKTHMTIFYSELE